MQRTIGVAAAAVIVALLCVVAPGAPGVWAQSLSRMRQYVNRPYYDMQLYSAGANAAAGPAPWLDLTTQQGAVLSSVSSTDDGWQRIALSSFVFPYFGHRHAEVWVTANGFVSTVHEYCRFDNATQQPVDMFCNWQTLPVPNADTPYYKRYIAPLMTDFYPPASSSASRVHYWEDTNAKRLYVQWTGLQLWNGPVASDNVYNASNAFTFQAVLLADGTVAFNYQRLPFDPSRVLVSSRATGEQRYYPCECGLADAVTFQPSGLTGQLTGPAVNFTTIVTLVSASATAVGTDPNSNAGPVTVAFAPKPGTTCVSSALQASCSACVGSSDPADHDLPSYLACSWCYGAELSFCYDPFADAGGAVRNTCPAPSPTSTTGALDRAVAISDVGVCANPPPLPDGSSTTGGNGGGSGSSGLSGGAKAGIAIGVIAGVALLAGVGVWCYRRPRSAGDSGGAHQQLGMTAQNSSAPTNTNVIGEHSQIREPSVSHSQAGGTAAPAGGASTGAALQPQSEPAPAAVNLTAIRPPPSGGAADAADADRARSASTSDVRPAVDDVR